MSRTAAVNIESLESRTLLAGVTILAHGHEGNITGWINSAANAIARRIGTAATSQYTMKVGENSSGNLTVKSFAKTAGPDIAASSMAEAIIKLDWTEVDDGSYSTSEVADVVGRYLLQKHGTTRPFAELPIHLIGHSRGASLVAALSRELGRAGVWVDQNTFLDPHPVDIPVFGYGDQEMRVFENVTFADNYWRDDGNAFNIDPDGEHVNGTYEGDLNDTVQEDFFVSAHMAVTAYYHGTIDTSANNNGDHPVLNSWYGNTADKPARDNTGYRFSRLGGGSQPASGLRQEFGGSASRTAVGEEDAQWSNAADLRIGGGITFPVGQKLTLRFLRQDRDGAQNIHVVLDRDKNPFNDNAVRAMRRVTLGQADDVTVTKLSALTAAVEPGRYYIYAKIFDDAGRTRFTYSRRITLTAPSQIATQSADSKPAAASTKPHSPRIAAEVLDLV